MYAKGTVSKKLLLLMVEKKKEDTPTVMKTNNKLKGKLHEIETQNCTDDIEYFPEDPTYSPSSEEKNKRKRKRKRKKRNAMQSESSKQGASSEFETLKSEDEEESSDDESKKPISSARKRTRYTDLYVDEEARIDVMSRAGELLARLEEETKLPSFVKCMLPSNVSKGFWLHLPKQFCTSNLPNHDTSVVLVDELGNEHETSYLLGRHGLSAGWRGFSLDHKLLKGDLLIFLLTGPCKFKVHIVRVNELEVIVAALCLMRMVTSLREPNADTGKNKRNKKKRKKNNYMDPSIFDFLVPSENVKGRNAPKSSISSSSEDQSSSSDSYGFSSEVIEGSESTDLETEESSYADTSYFA